MIRTIADATDDEIRPAPSISLFVGDSEPVFIVPLAGEDVEPGPDHRCGLDPGGSREARECHRTELAQVQSESMVDAEYQKAMGK